MLPGENDEDVFTGGTELVDREQDGDWIALPSADLLSIVAANELLRWRAANVIAVIGERNCGKTTLITELYERYLRGSFADHIFAHSRTIIGFEKKTFQSRLASAREVPDTPRTSERDGLTFFHLGLVSDNEKMRRSDLLISERAGETYRKARDRPVTSRDLPELRRADRIVFLLDGERVASGVTRAEVFASVRGMLRAFTEAEAINSGAEVQLVATKCDLLDAVNNEAAILALCQFEDTIRQTYGTQIRQVSAWRTAARDPLGKLGAAFGMAPLLANWLGAPKAEALADLHLPELHDEFDRLLVRRKK